MITHLIAAWAGFLAGVVVTAILVANRLPTDE